MIVLVFDRDFVSGKARSLIYFKEIEIMNCACFALYIIMQWRSVRGRWKMYIHVFILPNFRGFLETTGTGQAQLFCKSNSTGLCNNSTFPCDETLLLYVIFLIAKLMSLSQHILFLLLCLSAEAGLIKCK